jgi:hypothetical protein
MLEDDKAFQRVLEAYGGLALWRRLQHVVLQVETSGPLPQMKGLGKTFPQFGIVSVDAVRRRAEFRDYPRAGETTIFNAGTIEVLGGDRAVVLEKAVYRETFRGLKKYRRWSPADAVYFYGYALTTYFSLPFILCEYATGINEWKGGARVTARFPENFDTHSQEQTLWFDRDGLVVRHDYRADVVGWWATGAHFTSDYERMSGLPVARRRDVYARSFSAVTPIPVLSARLRPLEVKLNH